jgi:Fe-S-cluster containining protein
MAADTDPIVPALRGEIAVKRYGTRIVLEDAARRVRVPVDVDTVALLQALVEGPRAPADLVAEGLGTAAALHARVALLNRHVLLQTPRALEQLKVASLAAEAWPVARLGEAPLTYPEGLAHGCIACGSCCMGTDIGPLRGEDVAKIREIDWSPHLPADVSPADWLEEHQVDGRTVSLMGRRDNRCVFLGDDKLCIIHKVAGPQQKPTICRQFPYTFTRTPAGVSVSFSMECRSWWQARQRGGPVADDEAAIRALIADGAPLLELPAPVPVWDGLDWDTETWLAVQGEAVAAVRAAGDLAALIDGLLGPCRRRLSEVTARYQASERFAGAAAWGLPPAPVDPMNFFEARRVMASRMTTSLSELADRYRDVEDHAEADRVDRVAWALASLLDDRRRGQLADLGRWPHELEVWRDMVLAGLYAHDPARGGSVVSGLAELALRVVAGHHLSGMLARAALRVRTEQQDVVDSMVLLTKMLRGKQVLASLRRLREPVTSLFFLHSDVFTRGKAPQDGVELSPAYRLPGVVQ